MIWWDILAVSLILYNAAYFILIWFVDCDFHLFFKEKFGRPIGSLRGKVVWIVGASSGIGEYLAYELAKVNCKLFLTARREDELNKVRENCLKWNPSLGKDDVKVLVFDVRDYSAHKKALNYVISQFGQLDILVNNAGRSQRAIWENIDLDVDKDLFELNVFSLVALSRLVYHYFITQNGGKGHFVINSSFTGKQAVPQSASYNASKHSLHGYFESLRMEKLDKNIPITMVCPGPIGTSILAKSYTENLDREFGVTSQLGKYKLSSERCAHLMAVAMANHVNECWIARPIVLILLYISQYYPNMSIILINWVGPLFIQKLRDNTIVLPTKTK